MRDPFDDSPKEACGVFGVIGPDAPVAHLTYLGLYALQHRGQESAGMAVSDGDFLTVVRDMGLVSNVFDDRTLAPLTGHLAIGHTRYSTTGSSTWGNAQPVYRNVGDHQFALGHNGNLTNTAQLAAEHGMLPGTVSSDSDLMAELISAELAQRPGDTSGEAMEAALMAVLPRLEGAFSVVLMDTERVYGWRDPNGLRPLCLGRKDDTWVTGSESPALDIVGATMVREVEAGEVVVLSLDQPPRSLHPFPAERIDPKLCLFEFVYFARPDARLYGQSVHHARVRQGEALAAQAPVEADMVMGVPESGVPAAEGYARASGIPFGQGLVKNRYIGRTFIAPSQEMRALGVRMKFNPLRDNIEGRRIVVVDDSVVRGTTQHQLVRMLREAGAREVHLRLTSPPVRWPCFYGMDFGDSSELLAAKYDVDGIQEFLGVDSLAYIEIHRLLESTGAREAGFCAACFTGEYPIEVPVELSKDVLEEGATTRIDNSASVAAGSVLDQPSLLPADDAHRTP
ncbi:amidophosphoribosyltransferase [Iamia sp. SCSIO 61187]|uniref:amidophosphoribosyltransferase n=1 Tax=Iamia sp. SCSIO 61187 TaxID=2722752 RepID=UPI001C63B5A8|nr:amidophosphoribosyltransferase [Iamia sp. SCSIO 61187]QYG91228.1 amidophosphoribosyltransferase [Iamia sp. SCSIO 61187]